MHLHFSPKTPRLHPNSPTPQTRHKTFIQGFGNLGTRCCRPRRTAPLAAITQQRKLRNRQDGTIDVGHGTFHTVRFAVRRKNPQIRNFGNHPIDIGRSIVDTHPGENQQATIDRTDGNLGNRHAGGANPLQYHPHWSRILPHAPARTSRTRQCRAPRRKQRDGEESPDKTRSQPDRTAL